MAEDFASDREAEKVIRQNGNTVGDKKIYLKARRLKGADDGEHPGAISAGLAMWRAIDFLKNYKGYTILFEVAKEQKKAV